jgi:hypothetical protein
MKRLALVAGLGSMLTGCILLVAGNGFGVLLLMLGSLGAITNK